MSYDFDGSTDDLFRKGLPQPSYPLWMSCWFKTDTISGVHSITGYGEPGGAGMLGLQHNGAIMQAVDDSEGAQTGSVLSTGTWYHAAGQWTDNNNRQVWLDLTTTATDTGTSVVSAATSFGIGASKVVIDLNHFNGKIAEVVVGLGQLQHADISMLYARYSPFYLPKRLRILHYHPLSVQGDQLNDKSGRGVTLGIDTAPTYSDDSPVIQQRRMAGTRERMMGPRVKRYHPQRSYNRRRRVA